MTHASCGGELAYCNSIQLYVFHPIKSVFCFIQKLRNLTEYLDVSQLKYMNSN